MKRKVVVVLAVCFALVYTPVAPADSPAAVGKVVIRGVAEVNGAVSPAETSVFSGDRIATRANTTAAIVLPGGDQVFLPERTRARVEQDGARVRVQLEAGALAVVGRSKTPVKVFAQGVVVEPAGANAVFEMALKDGGLRVMSRRGMARVTGSNRTVEVTEGMTLDATTAPVPQGPAGAGAASLSTLQTAVLIASVSLGVAGFAMGVRALTRSVPQDCKVTGTTSPFTITCP